MVTVNKITFYWTVKKFWISLPEFVSAIDKGMQSFKEIYSVVMKLNRVFALHFFANELYRITIFSQETVITVMFIWSESAYMWHSQCPLFWSLFAAKRGSIHYQGHYADRNQFPVTWRTQPSNCQIFLWVEYSFRVDWNYLLLVRTIHLSIIFTTKTVFRLLIQ